MSLFNLSTGTQILNPSSSVSPALTVNTTGGGGALNINTGSGNSLFVDAVGNIGIGTTVPLSKLDVNDIVVVRKNIGIGLTNYPIRELHMKGELTITPSDINGYTAILNICSTSGNNGGNYGLLIRGLDYNGSTGININIVDIRANNVIFDNNITVNGLAFGIIPNYSAGINLNINQVYQASTNGWISLLVKGLYMNGIGIFVGSTNNPTTCVFQHGDDINVGNSKMASGFIPIPKGYYYKIVSPYIYGYAFEEIVSIFYPATAY